MTKTVNLNVRVQRISSTCEAHILQILHGNVLINMWHNYSRDENVIMTSSSLITQGRIFIISLGGGGGGGGQIMGVSFFS